MTRMMLPLFAALALDCAVPAQQQVGSAWTTGVASGVGAPIVISSPPPATPLVVRAPRPWSAPTAQWSASSGPIVATGVIQLPYQRQRFPFWIDTPRVVQVSVTGQGLDPTVTLLDAAGTVWGFDDDGGAGVDSLLRLTLAPGHYVAEVGGWSTSTGCFTLTIW